MIRFVSSDCANFCRSSIFFVVTISVVSSAYVYTFDSGTVWRMLFIYKRKRVVDSVLPCGIPCVIVCVAERACCVCVDCCLFSKYDLKYVVVSIVKLNSCCSFWISLVWDIVSYAFDRSIYIASVGFRFCICFRMLSVIVCRASVVLESDLKAYCVFDIILCLYRWVISCSFIIVSSAFAMIGSSDIGL